MNPRAIGTRFDIVLGALALIAWGSLACAAEPGPMTADQRRESEAEARRLYAQALRLQAADRLTEAIEPMKRCVEITRQLFPRKNFPYGHASLARAVDKLGGLLLASGSSEQAEACFRESLGMRRRIFPASQHPDGHLDVASSLNNLGAALEAQGSLEAAERSYREAVGIRQRLFPPDRFPHGHPDLAANHNNLGLLLIKRGLYDQAEPHLRAALATWRHVHSAERSPNGHPSLIKGLNNLGYLLEVRKAYEQAEAHYREALALCQRLYPQERFPNGHSLLVLTLNNLGTLERARGNLPQAEVHGRAALAVCRGLYPAEKFPQGHTILAASLDNLSITLQRSGKFEDAEPLLREALTMQLRLAERLAETVPEAVALNYAASLPHTRDRYLAVSSRLSAAAETAYEMVWQSKAALTRVYERRHLALLVARTSADGRQLWDDLVLLRRQREQMLLAPREAATTDRDQVLKTLDRLIEAKEAQLRKRAPAADVPRLPVDVGPRQLRQALPPGSALVDLLRYARSEPDAGPIKSPGRLGYLAFVLTGDQLHRVELASAEEIDRAVAAWREAVTTWRADLSESARRENDARAARLAEVVRRLVWEPVTKHLPTPTRVVWLAPDAALMRVPWAALPGSRPGTVLLEDHALSILPHAPFLLDALTRPAVEPARGNCFLAVGGVAYDDRPAVGAGDTAAARAAGSVPGERLSWPSLAGTRKELHAVVKQAEGPGRRAVTLTEAEAGTARVLAELPGVRWAHLATHGFFANRQFRSVLQLDETLFARRLLGSGEVGERIGTGAQNPLVLSGLVFAGANRDDQPDRGIVTADAIVGLPLEGMELAVLSACETGLGDVAAGEGVYGLQRAFHLAGARNVIASLWKVDDEATAALMTLVYRYLWEEKLPPSEALRQAQLAVYRHPDQIGTWAKGERGLNLKPRPATNPQVLAESKPTGRTPVKLWAAFVLSGPGS